MTCERCWDDEVEAVESSRDPINGTEAVTAFLRQSGRRLTATFTRPVSKRCPYVTEVDAGTLTLTFHDQEAPEMYGMAQAIDKLGEDPITHEAWTAAVSSQFPTAEVVSEWRTDVWTVRVEVR